jgi:hypothetical protein
MCPRQVISAAVLALLMAMSLPAYGEPRAATPAELYVDRTGKVVPFHPVYESWFGSDRYQPNYGRAAVENALMMALEVAIYWYDPAINVVDWQFPDLDSKLSSSEAVRFDDNLLRTNYVFHPIAGSSHYLLTRVNGFGIPGSFAVAAGSSAAYELLFEWRELVSVNDLIVTPFGGMAMGEFVHQLNNYLNSEAPSVRTELRESPGSVVRGAAANTLGIFRRAHDELDHPAAPRRVPRDNLGLSSAYGHEFRIRVEQSAVENGHRRSGELYAFASELELQAMPGFLRPGRFSRWYANGNFTSFDLRVGFNGASRENEMVFDSHLAGWYSQAIRRSSAGLRGHAFESGVASGLVYVDRQWMGKRDEYGIVHFPHPVQRAWLFFGPAAIELSADVSADFASVRSASYALYAERFGTVGTKSSLMRHSYAHSWGASAGAAAAVLLDSFELGGSVRFGHYESIDGIERTQEEVVDDTHGVERLLDLRAHMQLEPKDSSVSARAEYRAMRRDSRLAEEFRQSSTFRSFTVGLGLRF